MDIQLTSEQVLAMAPDSSSAAAGKKHGVAKVWKTLGMSAEALWGECQGSALYQVKVELASLTGLCSCPSRKLPCKHTLGLLLLAATNKTAIPTSDQPEWVTSWLAKRQANSARKQERAVKAADTPPSEAQLKNAEKRLTSVKKGLDGLDLWLNDLMRQGLANVQMQSSTWEHQASRLRDAQAGALDTRLRRLGEIPHSTPDWSARLLGELGKLALLTHAFRREEQLEPGMREELRQLIGWTLKQEEVNAVGETVEDDWLFLGQLQEEDARGKAQRTWLIGLHSGRSAMILQFSFAGQPFPEHFALGSHQEMALTFWPGIQPVRAQIRQRLGELTPFQGALPAVDSIDTLLSNVARSLSHQPWQERFLCLLSNVIPVCDENGRNWHIVDSSGNALPFQVSDAWNVLAISGGYPVSIAAEWNGDILRLLGMVADENYIWLGGKD